VPSFRGRTCDVAEASRDFFSSLLGDPISGEEPLS